MASIVSKFARAAFTTRASPSAVGGFAGRSSPAVAIRVSPVGNQSLAKGLLRNSGGSKSEEEEKARPKSEEEEKAIPKSEAAPHAATIRKPPLDVDENALKSKEAMWAFYEHWNEYHGRSGDRSEMGRRFRTFSATARAVHKFNNSRKDVKLSMNKFADVTRKEMRHGLGSR